MSEPDYSILICSRNEGLLLRKTIDDVCAHSPAGNFEIVVVDDASDDGSAEFALSADYAQRPIQLIRNTSCKGLIHGRAQAVEAARGHYVCILDAHCSVQPEWLERMASLLDTIDGRGLVVPRLFNLDVDSWTVDRSETPITGAIVTNLLDFEWSEPETVEGMSCTCAICGCAFLFTRDWYGHVGGLDREMVRWGGENIDFPLRTWAAGGWCVVSDDVSIGHRFLPPRPGAATAEPPGADHDRAVLTYNKIRAAHNVFSREVLEKVIENLAHVRGFRKALEWIRRDRRSLAKVHEHVESVRTRSDRWLIETFRLPLLEPLFFHLRPGEEGQLPDFKRVFSSRPRPLVSVVVIGSGNVADVERTLSNLLERTSYGNYDVLVVSSETRGELQGLLRKTPFRSRARITAIETSALYGGGLRENMAASATESELIAFLRAGASVLDDHWLERFILLFQRHRRLLMASPRVRRGDEEVFDTRWDDEAPAFSRERTGSPLAEEPYQALCCADSCFVVHRERFLELGGFDRTVRRGCRPLMDLAIHGWLSGYEVFCHPGICVQSPPADGPVEMPANADAQRWADYVKVLSVEKFMTDSAIAATCRRRSAQAEDLLGKNRFYIARRRSFFLQYARYDQGWLFFKFGASDRMVLKRRVRAGTGIRCERISPLPRAIQQSIRARAVSLVTPSPDETSLFLVGEGTDDVAARLKGQGIEFATETVVTVRTEDRDGVLHHLAASLAAHHVKIEWSHTEAIDDERHSYIHTSDDRKAEAVLRDYLILPDAESSACT